MTREEWLQKMSVYLLSHFEEKGFKAPEKYRVSCGLPHQRAFSETNRVTGQCWYPDASSDKHAEIFISPTVSDSVEVGAILVHELVHAIVGPGFGHRGPFRKCALKMGLIGKMTSTQPGPDLINYIEGFVKKSGRYPHAELSSSPNKRKQTTRMIKVCCKNSKHDDYIVRMAKKTLELASPNCGICGSQMLEAV